MIRLRHPRSPVHLLRQVAAASLAGLALVLALRPAPSPPAGPVTVPVVVAAVDLPAGAVLTDGELAVARLPETAAPAGATAEPDELTGQVLASPVRAGEPVTDVRLIGPGLWSATPDGQVAAPVRLADLAVATLLRPGDRVDVLSAAADDGAEPSVEVVAADALVLTTPPPARDGPLTSDAGLLVLAVDPDTAAGLAAAAATGTLTVTLGRP
ncbi:Flp pilus assembly protein CpaB [Modestobacter roseus]|uniref:Flp pilus assembly protein CpaB n=1 Tax=Modestobacter roseus TaxID=1181884 RepID=A0A562IXR9_9ACTN|nr:Flp pilus assembly protein CpaB [Modestobacter roseus]MQA32773.1 Flp pilus assembly protein CpaB [Modestobacter roseus]TWH75767.1 Flp pilus assembly protein CpaB [Modestobacter roseus]